MTLKLHFNTPCPHSQRDIMIKGFRNLGLSYERIYTDGEYSMHKFSGRLPTVSGSSDVDISGINISNSIDISKFKDVDFVEIIVYAERN